MIRADILGGSLTEATGTAISASYDRFCEGMQRTPGYYVEVNGDSVSLSFEPWFTESDRRFSTPCMRILLRRAGERIVLEQFVIDDGEDSRTLDIESAHDALQAWMDYLSD